MARRSVVLDAASAVQRTSVVNVAPAIAPLEREWDALADRVEASPFLRPGWISAWWSGYGSGRLEILHLRRGDGRLAGVLALRRSGAALLSTANAHTPEFGVLVEDAAVGAQLCQELMQRGGARISVDELDPNSIGAHALFSAASAASRTTLVVHRQKSPFLSLRDPSGPARQLTRKVASDLRRRRRRLAEQGTLAFDIADGSAHLEELLEEGFGIEGSGWKERRGTSIRAHASTRRHYTEVARWAAARGWLRLAFLRLDGRAIAFQFALQDRRRYYLVKGGYAPAYARFAPGRLLVEFTLDYVRSAQLDSYEFLGAAEPWKLEWTSSVRERILVESFARSPAGLLNLAARKLFFGARVFAKRLLVDMR